VTEAPFFTNTNFPTHGSGKTFFSESADRIVIDTKTIDRIGDHEKGQMLNYLKITGLRVGVILNFKRPSLEWERLVL